MHQSNCKQSLVVCVQLSRIAFLYVNDLEDSP